MRESASILPLMHGDFPLAVPVSRARVPRDRPDLSRRHGSRAPVYTAPQLPCAREDYQLPTASVPMRYFSLLQAQPYHLQRADHHVQAAGPSENGHF